MNPERLALGRKAQGIIRFHMEPTLVMQTVGAHTFGLCLLLIELTDNACSVNLLKAALFHDVAEAKIGDTPSPALRDFPFLKQAYKDAEAQIEAVYNLNIDLTEDEKRLLKLADRMELAFFALEDIDRGSRRALGIVRRVLDSIDADKLVNQNSGAEMEVMEAIIHRYRLSERRMNGTR